MIGDGFTTHRWGGTESRVFQALPESATASVLVLHEVWGFNRFVEEACRRLCELGYAAIAPLLYSEQSDLFDPETIRSAMDVVWELSLEERYDRSALLSATRRKGASEKVTRLLDKLYDEEFRASMVRSIRWLAESVASEGRSLGAIGFSMGGGLALRLAAQSRLLQACVVFSAEPPGLDAIRMISSPVLAFYGTDDAFMTSAVPRFVRESIECRTELDLKTYQSAGHEFFDPGNAGYDPRAASDSWDLTIRFLDRRLRDPHV